MQPYSAARKTLKWYKKLGIHLIQTALLNGHILYRKTGGKADFLKFSHDVSIASFIHASVHLLCMYLPPLPPKCPHCTLICALCALFQVISELVYTDAAFRNIMRDETTARLTECGHYPEKLEPTATWTKPQARCRVCSSRGLRRESVYICPICPSKPGLCMKECFKLWHTKQYYDKE